MRRRRTAAVFLGNGLVAIVAASMGRSFVNTVFARLGITISSRVHSSPSRCQSPRACAKPVDIQHRHIAIFCVLTLQLATPALLIEFTAHEES